MGVTRDDGEVFETAEDRRAKFGVVPRIFAKMTVPPSCDFCGRVLGRGATRLIAARRVGSFVDRPRICESCVLLCAEICDDAVARGK